MAPGEFSLPTLASVTPTGWEESVSLESATDGQLALVSAALFKFEADVMAAVTKRLEEINVIRNARDQQRMLWAQAYDAVRAERGA